LDDLLGRAAVVWRDNKMRFGTVLADVIQNSCAKPRSSFVCFHRPALNLIGAAANFVRIYLMCDSQDEESLELVGRFLFQKGYEVILPPEKSGMLMRH